MTFEILKFEDSQKKKKNQNNALSSKKKFIHYKLKVII